MIFLEPMQVQKGSEFLNIKREDSLVKVQTSQQAIFSMLKLAHCCEEWKQQETETH